MDLIGDETAIDDLRQLALETAESLARRLVLGEFALVVVSAEPRMHRLGAGGEVQRGCLWGSPGPAGPERWSSRS